MFARASADAEQALRHDPELTGALFLRGSAHFQQGCYEPALADFDQMILRDPRNVLAYNERGLVRAARGEFDLAIADYNRALYLKSSLDLARYNRAIALRLKGDHSTWPDDLTGTAFCGGGNWGSPSASGVQFLFCDGRVHSLNYSVSDPNFTFRTIMWQLMRRSDGTSVNEEF